MYFVVIGVLLLVSGLDWCLHDFSFLLRWVFGGLLGNFMF